MKKYLITLLIAAAFVNIRPAFAQQPAYDMMVDGVKVIVKPSGNDIVVIQTVYKGGVMNYPASKTGIEVMAMRSLTECGTLKHDKNSFKDALDKVSAQMSGGSGKDYSVFTMNCIKSDFDTVWPLYAEAITEPRFDTTEFARIRLNAINNLKQSESRPDLASDKLAEKAAFADRDYGKFPGGTIETLSTLTAAETKAYYYNTLLTKSRLVIVVVADLDRQLIENRVRGLLAGMKKGQPVPLKESFFRVYKNTFTEEQKDLATNYIEGITSGPQLDAPDYNAFAVAFRIFYDRDFLEIRTNNSLSYAPQVFFSAGSLSTARIRVSTTQPNKYIAVFNKLVDSTKRNGFTADELANMKSTYLTNFFAQSETNAALANTIASDEVLHGNWKRSLTLISDVKKLTLDDVNNAFRKYIGNIVWVYQGDPKKVNPVLFTNGTLGTGDNPVTQ